MIKKPYLQIVKHYENCLTKHGDNFLGVDWPNQADALLRYKIMLEIIPKRKKYSLLDFGCGTAHLYDFIIKSGYNNIIYTGLDISKEFIDVCMEKFPNVPFKCYDILDSTAERGSFDYIVINGVFNEKQQLSYDEMFEYFKRMIKALFSKAKYGIAFNVMSKHVDWEREDLFHLPFDILAGFLKNEVSRHFIIRNDYGLFEYSVYLFKEANTWRR